MELEKTPRFIPREKINFNSVERSDRRFSICLEPSVFQKVEKIALKTDTTRANVIRTLVKHGLKHMSDY